MSQKVNLIISFSSSDAISLIKAICHSLEPFNQQLPELVTDGYNEYTDTKDWINKLLPNYERTVGAYWGDMIEHKGFINYDIREQVVAIKISDFELVNAEEIIEVFAPLPWTVANFYDIFDNCENSGWDKYIAPGFIDGHGGHGWACAFKGEGHNHLVSRRWLEYGPWRLLRDEENDISFIQFHDLKADPATALEQAKVGHRAMSIYGVGGYIGNTHPFSNELRALYVPSERNMRVVIPAGKQITYSEMSDYCAARHFQAFENQPFDTLSFVFIVAEEAQPYLHDLWLREIECSGFTPQGVEVRLDTDYHPVPNPPEWVRRLEKLENT